jgi:hypothetical protein
MTQKGESQNYSAADHLEALLVHANALGNANEFVNAILVNSQPPARELEKEACGDAPLPVRYDPDRIIALGVTPEPHPLLSDSEHLHHDPETLARVVMLWFYDRKSRNKPARRSTLEIVKQSALEKTSQSLAAVESRN